MSVRAWLRAIKWPCALGLAVAFAMMAIAWTHDGQGEIHGQREADPGYRTYPIAH